MHGPSERLTGHVPGAHIAAIVELVVSSLLESKVSLLAMLAMLAPSGGAKVSVAPLWKLLPMMVIVWSLNDAGYEEGDTLLIDGAATEVTVKES